MNSWKFLNFELKIMPFTCFACILIALYSCQRKENNDFILLSLSLSLSEREVQCMLSFVNSDFSIFRHMQFKMIQVLSCIFQCPQQLSHLHMVHGNFRKFYLPLLANSRQAEAYFRAEFAEEYGNEFHDALQKMCSWFVEKIQCKFPKPMLTKVPVLKII